MQDKVNTVNEYKLQKNRKLICRVWASPDEPFSLAKKTVKYGTPSFHVKIGGKDRLYKINYTADGCIKQEGKKLYYDTSFSNTTGALRFFEFPEDMDSEEAYTALENNAVNMYVKKGGIPLMYLMVAMLAVVAMAFALIFIVPPSLQAQEQVKELDAKITTLTKDNTILRQQLQQEQGVIR